MLFSYCLHSQSTRVICEIKNFERLSQITPVGCECKGEQRLKERKIIS